MRKQPLPPNCAWKPDESASSHAEKRVKGRIVSAQPCVLEVCGLSQLMSHRGPASPIWLAGWLAGWVAGRLSESPDCITRPFISKPRTLIDRK
ncbi:hypothetical protein IG631_02447 [Alternaria alternata]|nr:hypothetical protein IG631_02447 [Alternaria alternata]